MQSAGFGELVGAPSVRVLVGALLALASPAHATFNVSDARPLIRVVATADGSPYSVAQSRGTVTVSAAHAGGNEREFLVPSDAPLSRDQESCAEWTSEPTVAQQGVVLRLHSVAGGVQAITVTKNIFFDAFWIINVHVWDTTNPSSPFTLAGSFDLSGELRVPGTNRAYPLPWFLCAAVRDSTLALKVWRNGQAQPAWGKPRFGGVMQLPNGFTDPGLAGWYIGHLSGGSVTFTQLATSTRDQVP